MNYEIYLKIIHSKQDLNLDQNQFSEQVIAALPQAKAALTNHELLRVDPLKGINVSVQLIQSFVENAPDIAFSIVCNTLVFIEEAVRQGFAPYQIIEALLGDKQES